MSATLPLRADLRGRSPYAAPQPVVPVRLATNENPYPPSPALAADLAAAVVHAAGSLHRYPDREAQALRADLAAYVGHPVDGVWAANGSNEVLQHLLLAFGGPGRRALGFEPSYPLHRLVAEVTATEWVGVPRPPDVPLPLDLAVTTVARHRPDVVFLCSPDNPTGGSVAPEVVAAVAEVAPGMVVVDEAYVEFSHRPSLLPLLGGRPRLVVTRTMSKAFAMAGARVGYLLAAPEVVDAMRLVRLPYHLSTLTQAAARVALAHRAELLGTVAAVKGQRDRLVAELTRLGVPVLPSDANFVLFGDFRDAGAVWRELLARGVLVRDVSGAVPGRLRVTAGTPEETGAFLAALAGLPEVAA